MGKRAAASPSRVSVVTITRNRRESLLRTLARLSALPERPPLIVVDNGSSDGTPFEVTARFPEIDFVPLPENRGAAARDIGVRLARTPYVAFSDDDSWWEDEALTRAAALLDAHPGIAVVAARILVGEDGRINPTCAQMARSPLGRPADSPGPLVLGFVACGAVTRRSA